MKKYIGMIATIVTTLFACAAPQTGPTNGPNTHQATIIVHKAPIVPDTVAISPHIRNSPNQLGFALWNNHQKTMYAPRYNVMDTMVVPVTHQLATIRYEYGFSRMAQTTLHPGDEMHLYHQQDAPFFTVANRTVAPFDGSLHLLLDSLVYQKRAIRAEDIFRSYGFAGILLRDGFIKKIESYAAYGQLFIADLQREQTIIDSLLHRNLLSADIHALHTDRIVFQQYAIRLRLGQYTPASAARLIDSLRPTPEDKPFSYYTQFCNDYLGNFIERKLPIIKGAGSVMIDYRRAYDSVKRFARPLHKGVQAQLLYQRLEQIAQHFSSADLARYLADYTQTTGDTASANALANAYLLDLAPLRQMADSVYLLNAALQKTTLDAILQANRGKVVFVDCWASWCLPCISAMPYTQQLLDKYGDKGLAVLFLSFDRKKDDWQKANNKHGLRYYKNNFMVVNPAMSAYIKKLQVNSLPRYLLFNKKGQLVNARVQDAKSRLTQQAIVQMLNE